MNILYVTGEAAPFCKTGGLADVSGSLPVALAARGHRVAVILPLYNSISTRWREKMTFRLTSKINAVARMLEDRVTVCAVPDGLEVEGITKDVIRIISNLEYRLRNGNE